MKFRFKFIHTPEYQASYILPGWTEAKTRQLEKRTKREEWPLVKIYRDPSSGAKNIRSPDFVHFPLEFYEIVETGECCRELFERARKVFGCDTLYPEQLARTPQDLSPLKQYEVNFATKMGMTADPSRKVLAPHPSGAAECVVLVGVPPETYSFTVVDSENRMLFTYAADGHLVFSNPIRKHHR